eukprot:GHRQ01030460.1.p3 GENE.GHRQ01030460.1~~GHRQ01030460.1.p3  ORF type:complete len:183 (+),score=41.51 GHRQ01030460.1:398-946(+)
MHPGAEQQHMRDRTNSSKEAHPAGAARAQQDMQYNLVYHLRRTGQSPAAALRLTLEVVLGLAHVHPVACQREGVQLPVSSHMREHLLLNAGGPQLDALQHLGAAAVDACVDFAAHKLLGLLHKLLHLAVLVDDQHAVLAGVVNLQGTGSSTAGMGGKPRMFRTAAACPAASAGSCCFDTAVT